MFSSKSHLQFSYLGVFAKAYQFDSSLNIYKKNIIASPI